MRRLGVLGGVVVLAVTSHAQQPTFRTRVDAVTVDVHVTQSGRPVSGLSAQDFEVTVDGHPRQVVTAVYESYPREHAQPSLPTAPATVEAPTAARTFIVVFDDQNIKAGQGRFALQAAEGFITSLAPADRVGLAVLGPGGARIDPTTNRGAVVQALRQASGHRAPLVDGGRYRLGLAEAFAFVDGDDRLWTDAVVRECGSRTQTAAPSPCEGELQGLARTVAADAKGRTRATLQFLAELLSRFSSVPGPKILVVLSEELPLSGGTARQAQVRGQLDAIASAAARAQVTVYAIQLGQGVGDASERYQSPSAGADADLRSNGLETVASVTGGTRLMVSGRVDGALQRVSDELSGQYLIGFVAEGEDRDGKPHEIRVRLKRPGLTVRARKVFAFDQRTVEPTVDPIGAGDATPSRAATRSAATGRAAQLLQGTDKDLRVLGKAQLADDDKKQRDHAKSLAQDARKLLQDPRGSNEADALSMATTASKQIAALVRRELKLDDLISAAERYRAGDAIAAVQVLSESLASDLETSVRYFEDNRDRFGLEGTALADVNDKTLAALALLETEVAFRGRYDSGVRLVCVWRLLGAVDAKRLPERFVQRWCIAVAGHLQGQLHLMDALAHVDEAVRRFPNDADVLAAAGMFYELIASPGVDLPARDDRRGPSRNDGIVPREGYSADPDFRSDNYDRLVRAKRTGFSQAVEFYRRALGVDATHAEAHLRLGRLLFLDTRLNDALAELRLAAANRDPRIHYLASMFEGAVQETATQFDAAVACYEEALRTCPQCLSAGLALSHAQRRSGDPTAAARTLDRAMARDVETASPDFWWDYPLGASWRRDLLMRDLRGELR